MSNDYASYLIYALGYSSIAYILLIILRHAIIYYIVKTLMSIMKIVTKKDFKYASQSEPLTDREDELKRDQKVEIFKQQASEIRKTFDKKNDDGVIEVDIQRSGGETSQGQGGAFAENSSRLSETKERQNERIVGIVDQNSLPKWQKMVFQKCSQNSTKSQASRFKTAFQVRKQLGTGHRMLPQKTNKSKHIPMVQVVKWGVESKLNFCKHNGKISVNIFDCTLNCRQITPSDVGMYFLFDLYIVIKIFKNLFSKNCTL